MAMDAKDLRTDSTLSAPTNDGIANYNQSSTTLQSNRNKSYHDIGSNSLGKVESQATRPCAIIGPDRVLPPPPTSDVYLKKVTVEPWLCNENVYRHQSNFTPKLPEYQQVRNISPRQTFQENMQRIMVPPSYNSAKNIEDPNLKNSKVDMPLELKYCDVPYPVNPVMNGQKSIRNSDIPMTSVNPAFARNVPPHGWASSVSARPIRPYGAPEFYQYPELSNYTNPRPISRPLRNAHDDSAQVNPERLYQEGNMRFKPYPSLKDRYPQARYDYASNYPNSFHPHPPFPPQKYDLTKSLPPHPYSMYSQVPMRRIVEPILDSYQRSNQQTNFNPYHNQYIPPSYGSVPGNCIPSKVYSHPSEITAKTLSTNKLPYDINNKMYLEYENNRNKMYPPVDNMYYTELNRQPSKGDVVLPMHPGINMQYNMPPQYMYRKDNICMKSFDNMHYGSIEQNVHVNSPLLRHPLQFSPSGIVISPGESNTSNDTIQTLGALQEDCGYVSQSSTASSRSIDSGNYRMQNEMYRKFPKQVSRSDPVSNSSDKKGLDVRQFLQMWNEGEEEISDNHKNNNAPMNPSNFSSNSETISNQEQLYVLGLVNIPNEDLSKYEHIQKISKLPENIKGYNSVELLDQYEQLVESPALRPSKIILRDYQISPKAMPKQHPQLPRPVSPLDVEAKISQSVIHKEVGCNFEIKPCSPKMLNVEVATPVQNVLDERAIEKVINLGIVNSSVLPNKKENSTTSCKMNSPFQSNNDLMKTSNYSFQDLESNSGVCLASLPRLDSDIELNFPEINQQFIDANKINTNPLDIHPDMTYVNNLLKPESSEFIIDKEPQKLSKYRKNKTFQADLSPDDNGNCSMNRTDSVIIENPDNIRKHDAIVSNVTTIIKENKASDNITNTPENIVTHSPCSPIHDHNIEDSSSSAIDFSLNKFNEKQGKNISETKKILLSVNTIQDDQNLRTELLQSCSSNNDVKTTRNSLKTNGNSGLHREGESKCNTEISFCLPLCEDVSIESICNEKLEKKISQHKNNVSADSDKNIKEDASSENPGINKSPVIENNDSSLPLFGENEYNNNFFLKTPCEKKSVIESLVLDDIQNKNITDAESDLKLNEALVSTENVTEYDKSVAEMEEVLIRPTAEYHSFDLIKECNKNIEDNDTDTFIQTDKSQTNNNLIEYSRKDDLSQNNHEVQGKHVEEECQLKGEDINHSFETRNVSESTTILHPIPSCDHVHLNNIIMESDILQNGDEYSDCLKEKHILDQNSFINENVCSVEQEENTCVDNDTGRTSGSSILKHEQSTVSEKSYLIDYSQSTELTTVKSISIDQDYVKTENTVNDENEKYFDKNSIIVEKESKIDNQLNSQEDKDTPLENSCNDFVKDENNEDMEIPDTTKSQKDSTKISSSTNLEVPQMDVEGNLTAISVSENPSEHDCDDASSNTIFQDEMQIEQSLCKEYLFKETSEVEVANRLKEKSKEENEQRQVQCYFTKKYFSPIIQNLIMYNEGIIGTTIQNNDITDYSISKKPITDTNAIENSIYSEFNVQCTKNIDNSESVSTYLTTNITEELNEIDQNVPFLNQRSTLKRSLSDSALGLYNDAKEHGTMKEPKRRKLVPEEILKPLEREDFSSIMQNNRRNSISATCNNQNVFILINNEDEYVIAQDVEDTSKICFTEVSTAFCNEDDSIVKLCVSNVSEENFVSDDVVPTCAQSIENEDMRETWVEAIAGVETFFNDDVAEDITISAPTSPKSLSDNENDDESCAFSDSESEHIVKIKEIYGDNMGLDDVQLVETLYKTPQMNVNKTLVDIESQNVQECIDGVIEEALNINEIENSTNSNSSLHLDHQLINYENKELDDKENRVLKSSIQGEYNFPTHVHNDSENNKYVGELSDCIVDSCDLSSDDNKESEGKATYSVSSSPEVSSTTSEEKGSSILLKITSVNGSRRSQINSIPDNTNRVSYKLTEIQEYTTNYRPLITKAAKKYIPPLKETQDLKVKLPLPKQSLYKLKQLKMAQCETFIKKETKLSSNPVRHDVPKKIKPKFEDVLKSIDEIQFKKHKEKNKKYKQSIPKVVIKKTENGAHYASSPNKKNTFNPDLTGRKWQPWVFIERNELVDKMAQKNKVKAVYCHRKKTFVLAEKFKKYKSICTAKFVITQPNCDASSSGNLKYTIRLKHNY